MRPLLPFNVKAAQVTSVFLNGREVQFQVGECGISVREGG
jgi:hypothetical protein